MNSSRIKKRIGILGGMGPEATALLMMRIIALTPAQDDSDHVPLIIDNNTQVPSRIKALIENNGADPGPVLQQMAQRLEMNGAQALAMSCNTAHYYSARIQSAVNIPLLNMIELAVERVSSCPLRTATVGLLGSPALKQLGLFDEAFSRQAISVIYPSNQALMLKAIRAIKADSRDQEARLIFKQACQELTDSGADILLVACTELSIISEVIPRSCNAIDAVDVLAQAVVDFAGASEKSGWSGYRLHPQLA